VAQMSGEGFVYLILASTGPVKIGRSRHPAKRLKQLAALPFTVQLIHQIETDDMVWLERKLHREFSAHRVNGEWFHLPDEDIRRLRSYSRIERNNAPAHASLHVWIDPTIRQTLTAYVEQTKVEKNATAVVELALRRYLQSVGFWPPPS
jgi:hypothetical protein